MAIELSTITFTDQDDIFSSGEETIVNTGLTNTLAGNDRLNSSPVVSGDAFKNVGTLNTDDGNDTITGIVWDGNAGGIFNSGTFNTARGDDVISGTGPYIGIVNSGTFNTGEDDDVIIGSAGYKGIVNSGTFNTGEGNDTITANVRDSRSYPFEALENTGTFNTGEGDDVITGESGYGGISISGIFDTGDGNDRIRGKGGGARFSLTYGISNYFSSTFNTGDGNDTIEGSGGLYGISNAGLINTGNGKDVITAEGSIGITSADYGTGIINSGTINTGNDDDIITVHWGIKNYGNIDMGDGNDSMIVGTPNVPSPGESAFNNFKVTETGGGDDIITADKGINNYGNIDMGDGDDSITANSSTSFPNKAAFINSTDGLIDTGEGNDIITTIGLIYNDGAVIKKYGISNQGTINTGNGQDSIISGGNFTNRGGVFLGDDNDSITASSFTSTSVMIDEIDLLNRALENFGFIGSGEGNDIITSTGVIYNEGVINTGNGDDSIIVDGGVDDITGTTYGIYNNGGAINMGDGNDSIIASDGFKSGENSSGAWFLGEGDDYIKGFGSGDFYGGNGNDTLELTPGSYTLKRWADNTGESVVFTKGNSLMITSEFEQLIAGGTTYDFASLTDGQIIVVA